MAQICQVPLKLFLENLARNEDVLSTSALTFTAKVKHLPTISAALHQNPATEHVKLQGHHDFMPANSK